MLLLSCGGGGGGERERERAVSSASGWLAPGTWQSWARGRARSAFSSWLHLTREITCLLESARKIADLEGVLYPGHWAGPTFRRTRNARQGFGDE